MTELTGGIGSLNAPRSFELDASALPRVLRDRSLLLPLEITFVTLTMLLTVLAVGMRPAPAIGVVALVLASSYLDRPGEVLRDVRRPRRTLALALGAGAVGAAVGYLGSQDLRGLLAVSVVGVGAVALGSAVRRRRSRVRVVAVGSATDIATSATRWAGDKRINLVGGLLLGDLTPRVPGQRGSVPGEAVRWADEDPRPALLRLRPDVVVVLPTALQEPTVLRRIGWALEDTDVTLSVATGLEGVAPHRMAPTDLGGVDLMKVAPSRPAPWVRWAKSVVDRTAGLLLLTVAAPLLMVLAVAIRTGSTGPALFTQTRVGRNGRPFTIFKLRTMCVTAEADKAALADEQDGNGLLFKKQDDPRVTRLGRVLRKYSLDELPQLINVVRGEMSLIGPRPALPDEVARYTPLERRRLAVLPGMTGAWQVCGRSTLDREQSMRLDVDYVDNYRFTDDVLIALRTVDAVARPKGAW